MPFATTTPSSLLQEQEIAQSFLYPGTERKRIEKRAMKSERVSECVVSACKKGKIITGGSSRSVFVLDVVAASHAYQSTTRTSNLLP